MSVLSDGCVLKAISDEGLDISPFSLKQLQPASYDLRLLSVVDIYGRKERLPLLLGSKEFILGSTVETLVIPKTIAAKFEGKSSLGRNGIMTHVSAGFVDPGFVGTLTLEIYNVSNRAFLLKEGMRIGQIMFQRLCRPAIEPYGVKGHYQNQVGPTLAVQDSIYDKETTND